MTRPDLARSGRPRRGAARRSAPSASPPNDSCTKHSWPSPTARLRTRPRAFGAALVGASCLVSGAAAAEDRDPWFGEDKLLHFSISAGLAGGGYAGSSLLVDPAWQRATAGAGFALSLGAAKELYDLAGHGDPSWRDFAWDALGTTVGIAIALAVDAALSSGDSAGAQTAKRGMAIRF